MSEAPKARRRAITWSVAIGLVSGYDGDSYDASQRSLERGRHRLVSTWNDEMEKVLAETGFVVSAVLTPATVLYPRTKGCPTGGENVIVLSGSSNPDHVGPESFDLFMEVVEGMVLRLQTAMDQNSVRLEFGETLHTVYSRIAG